MRSVFDHPWFKYGEGKKIISGERYKSRCPLVRNPPEWDGSCGMIGCPDYKSCSHSQPHRNPEKYERRRA